MSIIKTDPRHVLSCGIFYSILIGPTILSNLYLASLSLDQTFMILYSTRYRLIVTQRHVLIRIFLILIVIILIMIPQHYDYDYNKKTTIFICEFSIFINQWRVCLWTLSHAILFVTIPSIITCISSIILLQNRCNYRRVQKNKLSDTARRIERNSVLILFIVITLSFSILPFAILEIFIVHNRLSHHGIISSMRWRTYKILLRWFLILGAINYSFKFYLRLIISKIFQNDFLQLFNCNFQQKENNNEQNLIPINKQNRTKNIEN